MLLQLGTTEASTKAGFFAQNPKPSHTQLLTGLQITARLDLSRLKRKPTRSTSAAFTSKTAWAG